MTQAAVTPYVFHTTDAAEDTFSFPFHIDAASELKAYLDENAVSNFTVSGVGDAGGGTITFDSPPAAGVLFLYRATPQDQQLDLVANDPFSAEAIESAYDHIVRMIQDISESLSRRPALAQYTAQALRNLTLPLPGASKAIGWNQAGTGLVLYDTDDLGSIAEEELIHRDGSVPYTAPANFGSQALTNIGTGNTSLLSGTANPSVSPGVAAPVGAAYFRDNQTVYGDPKYRPGEIWVKAGMADTDWHLVSLQGMARPEDYGAEGDGSNDDSAAFELADEAFRTDPSDESFGTGVILLTPGKRYNIAQDVTLKRSHILGWGMAGAAGTLALSGASNSILIQPSSTGAFEFELSVRNVVVAVLGGTVRTANVPLLRIDNGDTAFSLLGNRFQVGVNNGNPGPQVQFDSGRHVDITNNHFFVNDGGTGLLLNGAAFANIDNNSFRGAAGTNRTGIRLQGVGGQNKLGQNSFENLDTNIADASTSAQFTQPECILAEVTWPAGDIPAGTTVTNTFTVQGAIIGASVATPGSAPVLPSTLQRWADVSAINTVRVAVRNNSGSGVDPGETTLFLVVMRVSTLI